MNPYQSPESDDQNWSILRWAADVHVIIASLGMMCLAVHPLISMTMACFAYYPWPMLDDKTFGIALIVSGLWWHGSIWLKYFAEKYETRN